MTTNAKHGRRAAAPTTTTTGAETSNALELVLNSSSPETTSATTPADARARRAVGRCASAMISAIAERPAAAIPTAVTGSCAVP